MDANVGAALLQASITGAGLVLAIFGLFIPIVGNLKERKQRVEASFLSKFKQIKTEKWDKESIEKIEKLISEYKEELDVGVFSKGLILLTFALYLISAICSFTYLTQDPKVEITAQFAGWSFLIASVLFLLLGAGALNDAMTILSTDKEVETAVSNIEQPEEKKS